MKRVFGIAVLTLAAAASLPAFAGEPGGGGPGEHKRPPIGAVIKIALENKDTLGLTDDQVSKLQALAQHPPEHKPGEKHPGGGGPGGPGGGKNPDGQAGGKGPGGGPLKDILNDDQATKLRDLVKAAHPGGPGGPGGPDGTGGKGGTGGAGGSGGTDNCPKKPKQ